MKLVVGLGNPGSQYASTRHNIGATMLEKFLQREQIGALKYDNTYKAELLIGNAVIFANPQTYMNLSGDAVSLLARFYKIPSQDILVLHDEIELPLGKIVLKIGGGAAGHNGLRSITTTLGNSEYARLRIGIGKSDHLGVADYVLQPFKPHEQTLLAEKEEEIFAIIKDFIQ